MVIDTFIYESSKLCDKPWGSVDKSELLKAVIAKPSLAEKIYLKIEPNWQEKPGERLSYPIADKNGTVYRYGLSSAMTYAKANNETEVINKLKKLYKKYGIDERVVIEAFVNEESFKFHGYDVVKQPDIEMYIVYDKNNKILCTVQSKAELEDKWNSKEGTGRDYSPAQIARAKKLKVWKVNCFDKYGGHVTDWKKFGGRG